MMDRQNNKAPFSATEFSMDPERSDLLDASGATDSAQPAFSDRLYQIAAVAVGLILLATAF